MSTSRTPLPMAPMVSLSKVGARLASAPLERVGEHDLFHDYVLGEYTPRAPALGKLRGMNVLVESFALAGVEPQGLEVLRLVREGYGPFRTVWGVKWNEVTGRLGWELYFYDFDRHHADCSVENLRRVLSPALDVDAEEPYPMPWHMFSIEFDVEALTKRLSVPAHLYIDMRSYELRGRSFTFENVYTFHSPLREIDDILHRLRSSVHFDREGDGIAELLPPSLFRCHRVCVANKRTSDALYASRIPTRALRWFLKQHRWPEPLARFVADNEQDFEHLFWCVGIDFVRRERAEIHKSGLYGSF